MFSPWLLLSQIPPNNDPGWENPWFFDDFISLNTSIWDVKNNDVHWNNDPFTQVYTNRPINVHIDSSGTGNLILTLEKENYICPGSDCYYCNNCSNKTYFFTSGDVETKSNYDVQYGYIEARINLPYDQGFWPAFWTINKDTSVNNASEIDIFEMSGSQSSTTMGTNLHMRYCDSTSYDWDPISGHCLQLPNYQQDVTIPSYANTYHAYGVEWSPTKINWYVDGNLVRNSPNPGIINPVSIILNFATNAWPDTTVFTSADMKIDYLKMYKLKRDACPAITTINNVSYNFTNYNNRQKKSISIGGFGGSVTYPANANISLRATDYIKLDEGFNVPLGAQIYIDVDQCY